MARPRIVVVIFAFILWGVFPFWAQTRRPPSTDQSAAPPVPPPVVRTYSVRGTLRKSDTNLAVGVVQLDLTFYNGERAASGFTQPNGEFEFLDLKPGSYNLTAEVEGYEPIRERIEVRSSSKDGLTIYLRKAAEVHPGAKSPTVSAHFLGLPQKAQEDYGSGVERLYQKKDLPGSLKLFQRAVSEAPDCYEAIYEIGVIQAHMKQFADAENSYRKSIELSQGKFARANVGLAGVLSNTGRFAEAEPVANDAVELDPNQWEALLELARAQVGLGKWEAAEKSALTARKLNPSVAPIQLELANIHIHKADYPAAVDDLEAFLRLQPNGPSSDKARETLDEVRKVMAKSKAPAPNIM